jgi:hypothetical protein
MFRTRLVRLLGCQLGVDQGATEKQHDFMRGFAVGKTSLPWLNPLNEMTKMSGKMQWPSALNH